MYVCIYIYLYICTYTHIPACSIEQHYRPAQEDFYPICMCVYIYIYIYMYIGTYTHIPACPIEQHYRQAQGGSYPCVHARCSLDGCRCLSVLSPQTVCMYVCMYVCICIHMSMCAVHLTVIHVFKFFLLRLYVCECIHIYICTYVHKYDITCTGALPIYIYIYIYILYTYTCIGPLT
jgi:hypothetical protein